MIKLSEHPTFGRIYQIQYKNRMFLHKLHDVTVIQTYGIRIEGSITCTNEHDLMRILRSLANKEKDVLIISPSTLVINSEIYKMFRILNSVGITLFLLTLQDEVVWYVDGIMAT